MVGLSACHSVSPSISSAVFIPGCRRGQATESWVLWREFLGLFISSDHANSVLLRDPNSLSFHPSL